MKIACLLLAALLSVWGLAPVLAEETPTTVAAPADDKPAPPPVVLELFTSQGCAFCPPADALMGQMAQQNGIIGLSCHVDYFGVKKNSLGKDFCTRRQGDYNRLLGSGPRYTPQLVVNGHMDMIGYETGKVNAAILKARGDKVKNISIHAGGDGAFSFSLPQTNIGADEVRLWMAVYDLPKSIPITEGSNFGKTVTYFNVVDTLQDLGGWDGKPLTQSLSAPLDKDSAGVAVIAQNVRTGQIIAAGAVKK